MVQPMPASSRRLKIVGVSGASSHLRYPPPALLVTKPCEVDAWKKERLQNVWLGTPANQWSYTANSRASVDSTGSMSGVNDPITWARSSVVGFFFAPFTSVQL